MSLIIPGYVVKELIEQGGFAGVYRVERVFDKKILAIKILTPQTMAKSGYHKLFSQEAQLLAEFNHPYIIKSEGVEKKAPRSALVLEYFHSNTLKALILKGKKDHQTHPLIIKHGLGVFRKILEALKYMHQNKVIHKDLKPENILISENGDTRLIDFNIAEKLDFFSMFRPRKIDGTVLYMSPEQILKKRLDARSDIYALGATFYEVFTGRPHIIAGSEKAILQKHLKGNFDNLRKTNKNVPQQLDNIIMRMLEKRIAVRYQNVGEVLFDLNKFSNRDNLF